MRDHLCGETTTFSGRFILVLLYHTVSDMPYSMLNKYCLKYCLCLQFWCNAAQYITWFYLPQHRDKNPRTFVRHKAHKNTPDSKAHGANMGPTWVLSAPCWPHEPCYLGLHALQVMTEYQGLTRKLSTLDISRYRAECTWVLCIALETRYPQYIILSDISSYHAHNDKDRTMGLLPDT